MKTWIGFFFTFLSIYTFAQLSSQIEKDSLIIVKSNPEKGFYNDYVLLIPSGTPKDKLIYLLVEPNNTGRTSDSILIHKQSAISLASESSVGNNISKMLKIPLLVPIFPRPASTPLIYTHALDRDVMLEDQTELKRIDLQLIAMIEDAKTHLQNIKIIVQNKFFMNGFSASGTFTNRFTFLHPNLVKAVAYGGFNGELMLPLKELEGEKLNYPLGINDFEKFSDEEFDLKTYKSIPQFIYMGALDENDAVLFDDAYDDKERRIIQSKLGEKVQPRWQKCQSIYTQNGISAEFKTYEEVGHWTTSDVNWEVIKFFFKQMQE